LLYICIPTYNEGPTIGVLLWRIRRVLQDYSRPYELVVYDDGSTDSTREILQPYTKVLPLSIVGGPQQVGYCGALRSLLLEVNGKTRYPRRDAIIFLQGDFTDQPESIPEFVKRFEGGADIVVGERSNAKLHPKERSLARMANWATRPFVSVPNVADPFGSYRLYRISIIRELLKGGGDPLLAGGHGWAANMELLLRAAPFAKRIESVALEPRFDLRTRESRVRPVGDALTLFRFGWAARKWLPAPART
jgi:glycosyltransferase involved in cell wall biosynthesis